MTTLASTLDAGKIGTRNSAMPGTAFALPTSQCITGSKLAAIEGSVCHGCYAVKSERMYTSVQKGWSSNYLKATKMIAAAPDAWARAMAFQIEWHCKKLDEPFHRWFDAGDLQSVEMLQAIILVCERTPNIRHWLPTREASIVAAWRKAGGSEPANLVIRISSTMIGDKPRNYPNTSTVHHKGAEVFGHDCPKANKTHATNSCEDCRTCWDKRVANVSYQFHR